MIMICCIHGHHIFFVSLTGTDEWGSTHLVRHTVSKLAHTLRVLSKATLKEQHYRKHILEEHRLRLKVQSKFILKVSATQNSTLLVFLTR
jgi:hypothetical protein